MGAFYGYWKSKRHVVVTIYLICCAYLIGLPSNLCSLEYFLSIFLINGLAYRLAVQLLGASRFKRKATNAEHVRDVSLLIAGVNGFLLNALMQGITVLYDHVSIPKSAFISVYCALLLLGSPMPIMPGDRLFHKIPRGIQPFLFLVITVSSWWRIGMLIPALFIYFGTGIHQRNEFKTAYSE